jgi:hypothetical protein
VFALGTAGNAADVHKPTSEGVEEALLLLGVPAGVDAAALAEVGATTLVECWKPHATVKTDAAAIEAKLDSVLFITNL